MALVPLLFSDWWNDLKHPHELFAQDFGLGLQPDQLLTLHDLDHYSVPPQLFKRLLLQRRANELAKDGISTVKADKDKFQVMLDVQQFKPDEINVKVVDKFVVIEAKHEEKRDEHGWISREFTRKYMIPDQCDIDQVTSSLSSDGVLMITAPKKAVPQVEGEKVIKIEHTGVPAINVKNSNKNVSDKDEKSDENNK